MVVVVLICILFGGLYEGAAKVILLHPCGLVESYVIISDLEYFQFLNMRTMTKLIDALTSTFDVVLHFICGLHQKSVVIISRLYYGLVEKFTS